MGEVGNLDAAEDELAARERKREKLDIVSLTPEAQAKYADSWRTVQIEFVDNPSSAVGAADRLVIQVMRERGYPAVAAEGPCDHRWWDFEHEFT